MATGLGGWRSDVPISMPRPLDGHGPAVKNNVSLVPMGGFTFTINGLFHDLSSVDMEHYTMSVTSPTDRTQPAAADLDARKR